MNNLHEVRNNKMKEHILKHLHKIYRIQQYSCNRMKCNNIQASKKIT